jgi:hypothetical protein
MHGTSRTVCVVLPRRGPDPVRQPRVWGDLAAVRNHAPATAASGAAIAGGRSGRPVGKMFGNSRAASCESEPPRRAGRSATEPRRAVGRAGSRNSAWRKFGVGGRSLTSAGLRRVQGCDARHAGHQHGHRIRREKIKQGGKLNGRIR